MTLRDLKDAVCGLTLHDLTPVNAESVRVEGGSVAMEKSRLTGFTGLQRNEPAARITP